MTPTWFRLYDEVLNDPKVQRLPDALFKSWINLMCIASKNNPRGALPSLEDIAFKLRVTPCDASVTVAALHEAGLIDERCGIWYCHNWNHRQYSTAPSAIRMRRLREKERAAPASQVASHRASRVTSHVTSQSVTCSVDTEQREIQKSTVPTLPLSGESTESRTPHLATRVAKRPLSPKYTAAFETFWANSSRRGSKLEASLIWDRLQPDDRLIQDISAGMERWLSSSEQWQDETKQPHVYRWLKRRGWEEDIPRSFGHGQTKVDRTIQNAQRLRARLDHQDRRRDERGAERSDNGDLRGTLDEVDCPADGARDDADD